MKNTVAKKLMYTWNKKINMIKHWHKAMLKINKIQSSPEERIIVAATKVFINKGLAGARVRHIATEANVNSAMIYYYYRSKHNLYSLVFDNALKNFMPSVAYLERRDLDIFHKIEIFCDELIESQISNPFLSAFILNEIDKNPKNLNKEVWYKQREKIQLFSDEVKRNINNGVIRKVEPIQLFMNIVSLCIFPFIATHLFVRITDALEGQITDFVRVRKDEVKNLVIHSIKKELKN